MKYLSNIDLNLNEIQNVLVHKLATDPVSPSAAQLWYNTTGNKAKYYDGTSVITLYDASTASTASKLVLRDSSGNIAANVATFASVTISNTPSADTDAATKAYVDSVATGLDVKKSVRVATDAALPANSRSGNVLTASSNGAINSPGIDGITDLALNDRVLVKNEATGANNGVYYVSAVGDASNPWTLTRTTDADSSAEVTAGLFTFVEVGSTNADTGWVLTTDGTITLNTTSLAFSQFSGGGTITAGDGLTKTGNTIDVVTASSSRIVVNANSIDLATTGVSASDYTKVTIDTYGRVTAGADIVSGTGLVTKTASGTFTARTITGTSQKITVTNGDGVSGNPTLTIASDYAGQTSITTLGTITTGTWTGTAIAVANGGTGATSAPSARSNLGAAGVFNDSITGDGVQTAFTVTHNLGNRQAMVQVFDSSYNVVLVDIVNPTGGNTSTVTFAVAPTNGTVYKVTVVG